MAIDAKFYMHESDKLALQTLQSIPGFTQLFKAFMKIWSEKQFRIQNMSTNLRISEKQLPKYYHMLQSVCQRLGIDTPELYLSLDVNPNAYTAGDTQPFIVITSGLLETMPEELIPTVLAHECGHIVCHHCLYTTMGRIVLSEAINLLGLNDLIAFPIQTAFFYWMRCSELSADRVAAVYDGSPNKTMEMCMRFAGFDKDIHEDINVEEFMNQADEYEKMVNDSVWNKSMEFIMFNNIDHPMNAVRARRCYEWGNSDRFKKICNYMDSCSSASDSERGIAEYLHEIPMAESSKKYIGKNYVEIKNYFKELGFANIKTVKNPVIALFQWPHNDLLA